MNLFNLLYLLASTKFAAARSTRHVGINLPERAPRVEPWATDNRRYPARHEKRAPQYLNGRTASKPLIN